MISRNALAKTLFLPKNKCRFGMLLTPKIVQNQVKVSLHNYSNVSDKFEMNVWVSIECPFTVPWVTLDRYMNNESNLTAIMKFHETSPAILNDAGLPTKMIRNPRNQGNLPNNMRSQYRVAVDHLQVQQYHICICIYIYIYTCRYNAAQFITILHTALRWQWQKMNQILVSQRTPHISPSRASNGVSIVRTLETINPVITAPRYMICGTIHGAGIWWVDNSPMSYFECKNIAFLVFVNKMKIIVVLFGFPKNY